jgi:hypothetical protein
MKLIIIIGIIVLISAIIMPVVMGDSGPNILIDNKENNVKYQKFDLGNPLHIILYDHSTGALAYDFREIFGSPGTAGNNEFIWFEDVSPGGLKHGVQKCIFPGSYDVFAEGTNNGNIISASGLITITEDEACNGNRIPPVPELSPLLLTSAGLLGIVFASRKYRGR